MNSPSDGAIAPALPHVVVVGAGYAGCLAAARLLSLRAPARVTVIDLNDTFAERVRHHQVVAGQVVRRWRLEELLPSKVDLLVGRVMGLDPHNQQVTVGVPSGTQTLAYDYLLLTPGSRVCSAPGSSLSVEDPALPARIQSLPPQARVWVVGGGLTGVEMASELAESHPHLKVGLMCSGEVAAAVGAEGRTYIRGVLAQLGVDLRESCRVDAVHSDHIGLSGGEFLPSDLTLWAAGFEASPLGRQLGLPVEGLGRVLTSSTLQVQGHPNILAAGDGAALPQWDGATVRMACASAMPGGAFAAENIVRLLRGESPLPFRLALTGTCTSLGRHRGLIQANNSHDVPTAFIITGRWGAWIKEAIVRLVVQFIRWESRWKIPLYRWYTPQLKQLAAPSPS